MTSVKLLRDVVACLKLSWRSLIATDLLYKLLAFVLLTPLFAALFRTLLTLSGNSVLSDVDIAMFFAGPFGWFCAIALGACSLGIVALEQTSLLWILAERSQGKKTSVLASLRFAAGNATNVLRVTARMIGWSLLAIAPFLLIAGGVYVWLLTDYDINYYLAERPLEFKIALTVGLCLALALAGVLLRLYSGWFLALPLVLFQKVSPKDALLESRNLVTGQRRRVVLWLALWIGVVIVSNILLTALVGGAGRLLIPTSVGSLALLVTQVGLMLLVMMFASLAINLIATIGFAGMLFQGFQLIDPSAAEAFDQSLVDDTVTPHQRAHPLLTRWGLVGGGLAAAIVAAFIGSWSLKAAQFDDQVEIMAHRGASSVAPENTMAAYRQAIADGADWIEIDVQETADGEVVVMHDSDFMKLASNPLKIWDATREDLVDIDIGSWFDPKFSNERVPTLREVLQLCKDKIGVNIELKYYGHDQQLEQRVIDIVEQEGMVGQIMVMSLKPAGVNKTKALRPDWTCGLLLSVYVGNLEKINADFLAVNANFASRSFVNRAHQSGKKVFVWTVNDAALMSQVMNCKVDGILTDRPDLAKAVVAERAEMTNVERLLTEIAILVGQPPVVVEP